MTQRLRQRIEAIDLIKEGWRLSRISKKLKVHRVTVSRWMARYRDGGVRNLRSRKSKGAPLKLDWTLDCGPLEGAILTCLKASGGVQSLTEIHRHLKKQTNLSRVTAWSAARKFWISGRFDWEIRFKVTLTRGEKRGFRARLWKSKTYHSKFIVIRSDRHRYFFMTYCGSKKCASQVIQEGLQDKSAEKLRFKKNV